MHPSKIQMRRLGQGMSHKRSGTCLMIWVWYDILHRMKWVTDAMAFWLLNHFISLLECCRVDRQYQARIFVACCALNYSFGTNTMIPVIRYQGNLALKSSVWSYKGGVAFAVGHSVSVHVWLTVPWHPSHFWITLLIYTCANPFWVGVRIRSIRTNTSDCLVMPLDIPELGMST